MSGVHGHATTFGRIPFSNHTSTTMIKGGPLAASSQDAALTYAAVARNAPGSFYNDLYDGGMHGPPEPHLRHFADIADLSDVRIGIFPAWFQDSAPAIQQRCRDAVAYLKSRGATVVEVSVPHLQVMSLAHAMKISSEFALGWDAHFYNHPSR
jgi:Asp-tRNA(Asn)/Glu-tRNA(Gln) amidotransferase A subunit family amidase